MKKGKDVLLLALALVGCKYVLGATVHKDEPHFKGPFDCAEFVAYCNFQTFGILYGCDTDDLKRVHTADAYTGYFGRDAKALGKIITVAEAAQIPGAIILRVPAPGAIGHVVFSQGNGKTVEANCTKYGCIESVVNGRRFDMGILLPGIEYTSNTSVKSSAPAVVYRLKSPYMVGDFVGKIQKALQIPADNIFGDDTNNAVVAFQEREGLVVDGEVMPGGQTARALGIL